MFASHGKFCGASPGSSEEEQQEQDDKGTGSSSYRKTCPTCSRVFTHPPAFAGHVMSCGQQQQELNINLRQAYLLLVIIIILKLRILIINVKLFYDLEYGNGLMP